MAIQVSYPGVYIEEFAPGAPIEGVGTNTAAFIGVAARGDLRLPTKITSWDQFRDGFGDQPVPGFYLWYAVRGFFENSGQVCYVVRASNGEYGQATLLDRSTPTAHDVIRVRARQPGQSAISVTGAERPRIDAGAARVFDPSFAVVSLVARVLTLAAGAGSRFRPGDVVTIEGSSIGHATILRVSGDVLRLDADLTGPLPP